MVKARRGPDCRPNDAGRAGRTYARGCECTGCRRGWADGPVRGVIWMDGCGVIHRGQEVCLVGGWAAYSPADFG